MDTIDRLFSSRRNFASVNASGLNSAGARFKLAKFDKRLERGDDCRRHPFPRMLLRPLKVSAARTNSYLSLSHIGLFSAFEV
jgi:hypothetical protein